MGFKEAGEWHSIDQILEMPIIYSRSIEEFYKDIYKHAFIFGTQGIGKTTYLFQRLFDKFNGYSKKYDSILYFSTIKLEEQDCSSLTITEVIEGKCHHSKNQLIWKKQFIHSNFVNDVTKYIDKHDIVIFDDFIYLTRYCNLGMNPSILDTMLNIIEYSMENKKTIIVTDDAISDDFTEIDKTKKFLYFNTKLQNDIVNSILHNISRQIVDQKFLMDKLIKKMEVLSIDQSINNPKIDPILITPTLVARDLISYHGFSENPSYVIIDHSVGMIDRHGWVERNFIKRLPIIRKTFGFKRGVRIDPKLLGPKLSDDGLLEIDGMKQRKIDRLFDPNSIIYNSTSVIPNLFTTLREIIRILKLMSLHFGSSRNKGIDIRHIQFLYHYYVHQDLPESEDQSIKKTGIDYYESKWQCQTVNHCKSNKENILKHIANTPKLSRDHLFHIHVIALYGIIFQLRRILFHDSTPKIY